MSNPKPVEGALERLVRECRAVLAFEHELREISVLGNTNVNVFKMRVEEAEAALPAAPARDGVREALDTDLTRETIRKAVALALLAIFIGIAVFWGDVDPRKGNGWPL